MQLVFQTAFIGDLLLGSALLKQIRQLWPNDPIGLVCRKGCGDLFLRLQLADEVFEVDKKDPASWEQLRRSLREREFRRIFCPHESFRSAWFVRSLKSPEKIGFKKWWNGWIFTHRLTRPMQLAEPLRQLSLITALDVPGGPAENLNVKKFSETFARLASDSRFFNQEQKTTVEQWPAAIPLFADITTPPAFGDLSVAKKKFSEIVGSFESTIFIAPGSVWATKMWTVEGFREVAQHFVRMGNKVIFTGSPAEAALCAQLAEQVPGSYNLAGKTTLVELHALFSLGDLVISNDSSPIHMAAMAGTPCVGIFGATTLKLGFRPWSNAAAVAQIDLECRPCGLHGHKKCPLGHHKCMRDLPASQVIALAEKLLA